MKLVVVGTGYVGLVSGTCFSDFGHTVVCTDSDAEKIARIANNDIPIYEPDLANLLERNQAAGRLKFKTDLTDAMDGADAVFIAVGTPSRRNGNGADVTFVNQAAHNVAEFMSDYIAVVLKSTVPVGTARRVGDLIRKQRPDVDFDMVANPEFLREGSAVEDFMHPERIIVGTDSERAREVMAHIYRPLYLRECPIVFSGLETAEITKYAANAFLATKVSFINEIAELCERAGGDVQAVAQGMGMDRRISGKFLHAGAGFGGSCLPKDTSALAEIGRIYSAPQTITEATIKANEATKTRMIRKIVDLCGGELSGKLIAVLGVTFKPSTDDVREAPSLTIVPALMDAGASVRLTDPQGRRNAEKLLPGALWADDPYACCEGADAVVLMTEWNEFRALDLDRLAHTMACPRMADLRNVFDAASVRDAGFVGYSAVGRSL